MMDKDGGVWGTGGQAAQEPLSLRQPGWLCCEFCILDST